MPTPEPYLAAGERSTGSPFRSSWWTWSSRVISIEPVAASGRLCHHAGAMALVKMGKQGRIVIPSEIRSRLDFDEGDELRARVEDGRLVLESPSAALATVRKKLSEGAKARSLTDELIERRRAESGLGQAHLER